MRNDENPQLRATFHKCFPKQAAALEAAQTEEEVFLLYETFVAEAKQRVADLLKEQGGELEEQFKKVMADSPDGVGPTLILPPMQIEALNATGDQVKTMVESMLNTMANVHKVADSDNSDAIDTSLAMWGGLAGSYGLTMAVNVIRQMAMQEFISFSVSVYAVAAVGTALIAAITAAIVLAVFIPILYFIFKPATTTLMLINNTKSVITLKGNPEVEHGKVTTICPIIQQTIPYAPDSDAMFGGLYQSTKRDSALVGTTVGYEFEMVNIYDEPVGSFALGVSCPLTKKSKVSCAFNATGAEVLDQLSSDKTATDSIEGYELTINLNSTSGGNAYFIASISEVE